jgi:molybdate transport system substrate-binding protein
MKRSAAFAVLLPLASALFPAAASGAAPLRVFAAASLTDAFGEIAAAWREANPGEKVELNVAGSQLLRVQIEQGADADVLASADLAHMEALQREGLVSTPVVFARNRLAVVTTREESAVRTLADLARPGVRIVVAGPDVPAGRYTNEVLGRMSRAGIYGDDFERGVKANVVSLESNVRAVLTKVVLGEADAGFVYTTDARAARGKVAVLEIPDAVNAVAEYPIAAVTASPRPRDAARFIAFVLGERGQAILRERGFQAAP